MRNGAPFVDWKLPQELQQARAKLRKYDDGDRQFVGILALVPQNGLQAVTAACKEALTAKTISRDLVLNILSRATEPKNPTSYQPPDYLPQLSLFPEADCHRYDQLLNGGDHAS